MIDSIDKLDKIDERKIKYTLVLLSQLKIDLPIPTIWIDADLDIRLDWTGNALEPLISLYVDEHGLASFLPVSDIAESIPSQIRSWDINNGEYLPSEWIELIREVTQ